VPDPQAESTFRRSRLRRELIRQPRHAALREYYRELIRLRKEIPALAVPDRRQTAVVPFEEEKTLLVRRWRGDSHVAAIYHFGDGVPWRGDLPAGTWRVVLDSADERWQGPGSRVDRRIVSGGALSLTLGAKQAVLLVREED